MNEFAHTIQIWYRRPGGGKSILHSSYLFDGLSDDERMQTTIDLTVEALQKQGYLVIIDTWTAEVLV
tara:strand:+ start:637 stop:837 length:201 start_codon:yes stop_codon:yes gene_type:complete